MWDLHRKKMDLATAKNCLDLQPNTQNGNQSKAPKVVRNKIVCQECGTTVSGTGNYNRHKMKSCKPQTSNQIRF